MASHKTLLLMIIVAIYQGSCATKWKPITSNENDDIFDNMEAYDGKSGAIALDVYTDNILLFIGNDFLFFNPIDRSLIDYVNDDQMASSTKSQYFTQLNHELWMIRNDNKGFSKVTLHEPYVFEIPDMNFTVKARDACLASTEGYIFVIGGTTEDGLYAGGTKTTQIYNIENNAWLEDTPLLNEARVGHACIAVDNKIYVFGGYGTPPQNSIEVLDASDVYNIEWELFACTLSQSVYGNRAVAYGTDIYVIGGWSNDMELQDVIHVIDTQNEECKTMDNTLLWAVAMAPSIIANDVLYVIAPNPDNKRGEMGQYLELNAVQVEDDSKTAGRTAIIVILIVIVLAVIVAGGLVLYKRWKEENYFPKEMVRDEEDDDDDDDVNNADEEEAQEDKNQKEIDTQVDTFLIDNVADFETRGRANCRS